MTSVYKRKDGSWDAVVALGMQDGKQQRRHFQADTQAAAEHRAMEFLQNRGEPETTVKVDKPERSGVTHVPGKSVTITSEPGKAMTLGDVRSLLEWHGLNPDDWQVGPTTVNKWETPAVINKEWVKVTNYQLKVSMTPRLHLILPQAARLDGPLYLPGPRPLVHDDASELMVMFPDQQAPYYDEGLHQAALGWLEANKPDRMILSGDLFDFPTISKHARKAHELSTTMQLSLDSGYRVVRDYAQAAGPECWDRKIIKGNHEERLQNWILEQVPQIYRLHRPEEDETRLLSLEHLSRLDELGFEWAHDPVFEEDYPQGHVTLNDNLAVYHGWIVRPGAGDSALKTLETLGHSVMVGHTHRQAIVSHTFHEIDGKLRVLRGVEAGTMARARGGLGYSMVPNWQQGFAGAWLHPDGSFNVWLATWVNGKLLYGSEVYVADGESQRDRAAA